MNPANDPPSGTTALPQLEQLLVRAARRRLAPRFASRRLIVAAVAASLAVAGGAAAATGVIHLADGTTSGGSYSIESRPSVPTPVPEEPQRSICLQLRYNGGGPTFGCGERPSAGDAFGVVIADSLEGSAERVIYGLAGDDIATVAVLRPGGGRTTVRTEVRDRLPGRFFSLVAPRDERIEIAGYDSDGKRIAKIGSLMPPSGPPHSREQAIEQGDPAGFAPTAPPAASITYRGRAIPREEVSALSLSCMQSREALRCYDSTTEAERKAAADRP